MGWGGTLGGLVTDDAGDGDAVLIDQPIYVLGQIWGWR